MLSLMISFAINMSYELAQLEGRVKGEYVDQQEER